MKTIFSQQITQEVFCKNITRSLANQRPLHYSSGASTLETKGKKRFFSNGIDTLYGATYMSWAYQLASINRYNLIFYLSGRLN